MSNIFAAPPSVERPECPHARDVVVRFRLALIRWYLGLIVAIALAGAISAALGGGSVVMTPIAVAAIFVIAIFSERVKRTAALHTLSAYRLHSAASSEVDTILSAALRNYATFGTLSVSMIPGQPALLTATAKYLAANGQCGTFFRFASNLNDLPPLEQPMAERFMPTPLQQRVNLGADTEADSFSQRMDESMEVLLGRFSRFRWARWLHWVVVGFGFCMIGFALFTGLQELTRGQTPTLFRSLAIGLAIAGPMLLARMLFPAAWLLVPGCIIVRTAKWHSSTWELHQFTRANSVLIYWRDLHRLAIARDDGRAFMLQVSPRMATNAYRAWASPIDPPPVEQLSDLR